MTRSRPCREDQSALVVAKVNGLDEPLLVVHLVEDRVEVDVELVEHRHTFMFRAFVDSE